MSDFHSRARFAAIVLLSGAAAHATDLRETARSYVEAALSSNLALHAQTLAYESSLQALLQARSAWWPRLALASYYTRAEVGRTIDVPTGDLVNPIYSTLNQLTTGGPNPTQFAPIANESYSLVREREQDTRLVLTAPLFAPAIGANVAASAAAARAHAAQREAFARVLVRDVQRAYYGVGRAQSSLGILQVSANTLRENLRIAQVEYDAGRATREPMLRAQSELLGAEQQLAESRDALAQAQRYLNFLVNRPPDTPVEILEIGAVPPLVDPVDETYGNRPELRSLGEQIAAATAGAAAVRSEYLPTLSLRADYGIQGAEYRFDNEADVGSISLVLSWTLFDGADRRSRLAQRRLEAKRVTAERDSLQQQLMLALRSALESVRTQAHSMRTAEARRQAADEAFRIAVHRRDIGSLLQVEFLDAQRERMAAQLGERVAIYAYYTSLAELELAAVTYPLPLELQTDSGTSK